MAVMAWFKKERKPRTSQRERLEIPPDAWEKCDGCGHIDLREKFEKALNVCPECGRHRRIGAEEYIELLTDPGSWREMWSNLRSADPLHFEHYSERLASARKKGGQADGIYAGAAKLDGLPLNLGVMNFAFMGGSMGSVVGEKIARLARRSHEKKIPLVLISASGGARMQEGVLSLMQMAKTSAAIALLHRDAILAEPGALIGFAGQRVIKQTIGQDLPDGFQTAEFLLEHGQIDDVVPRGSLRDTTARLLWLMRGRRPL